MRPRRGSAVSSPVLIGAVTVLVTIVAVFLAYNANSGLPFVPRYQLEAELANASGLTAGNEVRLGGARVGTVGKIAPLTHRDGSTTALLRLDLERSLPELPTDSRLLVRSRSALGLKYVELTLGGARTTFADGDRMPLRTRGRPVEIDDLFNTFDEPTRAGSQTNLDTFGNGFAGRGGDLNRALAGLDPLTEHVEGGARNLADPRTRFDRLFPAFEQAASEVAPVAREQGELFAGMHRSFGALSDVRPALRDAIAEGPEALATATRELPAQARFTDESTELFRRMRPAFAHFASASRQLAPAFADGIPALRRAPALNRRLVPTLRALERFAADARVAPALARIQRTAELLKPTIAFATPAQTRCNYFGLLFRNLASALSESDRVGSFLRFGILALPQGPNSEAGPAAAPANGPASTDSLRLDSFLHTNPYPNTAAPGQPVECEAGNEGYRSGRQAIGNVPGVQGTASEKTGDWKATP